MENPVCLGKQDEPRYFDKLLLYAMMVKGMDRLHMLRDLNLLYPPTPHSRIG